MAEEKSKQKHRITMEHRERLFITGVYDVLSFDEECVTCETDCGMLIIKGYSLHVTNLNLDGGELDVEGEIDSLYYQEGGHTKTKGSFFSKMFK